MYQKTLDRNMVTLVDYMDDIFIGSKRKEKIRYC